MVKVSEAEHEDESSPLIQDQRAQERKYAGR